MKVTLRELMDHLAIDKLFEPYDSSMWSAHRDDDGLTCTAQANMNAEGDVIELDIQTSSDNPAPGTPSAEQIMFMHIKQDMNKKWAPDILRVKKELYHAKVYDWQKKGCEFFVAVTTAMARDEVPDLDALIERIFKASEGFGSGTASGGSRKPMIRPEQLLDPTKKF